MRTWHRIAALTCVCIGLATNSLRGAEPLRVQVSPPVSRAPALLTVRVSIEATADNRALQVVAESPDFYRSSEISIDGTNAAPLNVFEFRNLPTGLYQVTSTLIGAHGTRATILKLAKVEPAVGSSR